MGQLREAIGQNQTLRSIAIGYSHEYCSDGQELFIQYGRTVNIAIANPHIVHFDWVTVRIVGMYNRLWPTLLPRLQALRST